MGSSNSKKPEITIKSIRMSTEDIRSSLRSNKTPIQKKEDIHQTLINNSKKLNTLRSKKSKKKQLEIDQLQKLVSDVNEELLEYNDAYLDKSTDESHSFIHVEPNQLKKQKKNLKTTKANASPKIKTLSDLGDIERELSRIKNDVSVGIKNDDNKSILLQKKKIEMLSTDLELLDISETSPLYEKKQQLEKDLYRYYQKIIRREKSQARLSKMNPDERSGAEERRKINASRLNDLEIMIQDIQDVLQNTMKGDYRGDTEALREEITKIDTQLNQIEDKSKENMKSRTILLRKVDQLKKNIDEAEKKKEMGELVEMTKDIDKKKTELLSENKLDKTNTIEEAKKLMDKLRSFSVKYSDNELFRTGYLGELDKFLEKIDPNHDGIIMRQKKLKSSKSVDDLMHLQEEWKNLEKNMRSTKMDELQKVNNILEKFEESIRAKRKSLANLLNKSKDSTDSRRSYEVIRTSAKISELPKLQTTSRENVVQQTDDKNTTPLKYGTIDNALQEITKISDRVEEIGKKLLNYKGTSEDLEYNFFKASLMDKKKLLLNLNHRTSWKQVDVFKVEVLEKVAYYEDYLQYKLNQNILEMKLNEKLNDLDNKIKRFTGSYQNVQFRNIEEKLSNCMKEAESVDWPENSEKLRQRTNYLKKKLKERSQMDFPLKQEENLTDTKKVIAESKEYIQNLRRRIEQSSDLDVTECSLIEECIMSKTLELINVNLKNDTATFQDVRKLLENIEDCKMLVRNKRRKVENRTRSETFSEIEIKLVEIYKEISDFDGLSTDENFKEIHRNLNDLEVKLCGIQETENTQGKTLELSLRVNLLKTKLDQVALESEQMLNLETRVKEILDIVSNGVPESQFDKIDEELINLRIRLEKLDVSEKLSYKKLACLNYIEYLLKKLNEKPEIRSAHVSRSVIV